MVIKTFRTIALGEFIPYEWVTEPLAEAFESKSEDGTTSRAGVLSNMGVMLPILVVLSILSLLVGICVKYYKKGSKVHNLVMKVKKKVFYNSILRFIM